MDYNNIWQNVLIQARSIIDQEISFNTWILPLKIRKIDEELKIVYMELQSESYERSTFMINNIKKRYLQTLEISFKEVLGDDYRVILKESNQYKSEETVEEPKIEPKKTILKKEKIFNPRFTFDNFVVGNNNIYAHAAALAVAESPSEAYNPLFIYGGSGLGKTHLMHAIGIYLLENNPNMNVLYVSSEMFTNDLIKAINNKKMNDFKAKYRQVDALLIDDIQFLEGKESTQEEFFHTFTTLYEGKKQIVISSDKPPKDINGLEDRLITRFKAGLTVDVQPPNYETRMAILKKRAELDNIQVDDESLNYIATNIKSSIRELEGALKQIYNFSRLRKKMINFELTKEALENIISPEERRPVTCELIIDTVAEHYHISPDDIKSSKRNKEIAYPRQICMYLCRKMTADSLQAVGNSLGKKDHTTIIHGEKKISDDLKHDENLKNTIDILIKKINPPT